MTITQSDLECMLSDEFAEPTGLPLSLLEEITNGFSDKLEIGRGGFAVVYKGMLDNGAAVAVKKWLSSTYMYDDEFQGEVECLKKVKHKNIVRFLGYCSDTQVDMEMYNGRLVMVDTRQRLLCFEYLPKGSLYHYIKDSCRRLEWTSRYKIIKGICEGLNYLHQKNILHLDLKPANILLDEDMMPKINDFGLSKCFEEGQTWVTVTKVGGTIGYLAPEFTSNEITHKFDIYSLGVIIIEILTGKRGCQDVDTVLESWSKRSDISQLDQIRVCAEIGIECIDFNPGKRPLSMKHIIDRLIETESVQVIPVGGPSELLVLDRFALCFPFEPNKVITCPLQLTNITDKHVAFRLMGKSGESFLYLPLYGIVPPRSPYTLTVTAQKYKEQPRKSNMDLVLDSTTMLGNEYIDTFQSNPDNFFQQGKRTGNIVHEITLRAMYTLQRYMEDTSKVIQGLSGLLDVHPVELIFHFERNKSMPSLLHLQNNTDKHVAFKLKDTSQWVLIFPMYGVIPPRSTHSLVVVTQRRKMFPQTGKVLILESSIVSSDNFTKLFNGVYEELWKHVRESGIVMHEVKLKSVYTPQGEMTFQKTIPRGIEIISIMDNLGYLFSVDANLKEPWVVFRKNGQGTATIVDYVTQEPTHSFEVTTWTVASSPKFFAQREWLIAPAANDDGRIHVYNYKMEKVDAFTAGSHAVSKLAVHPTKLRVLSMSWTSKEIKLWDWDNCWKLSRTFVTERTVNQLEFCPKDSNINGFAITCIDHTIEVWDLDSSQCSQTLFGHQDEVKCLGFFKCDNRQHLITGANDKTAKIWDMEKMNCVHTLEGFLSPVVCVFGHPNLPVLVTGTEHGIIHVWSSVDFRLKMILDMGDCGKVLSLSLACSMESTRVVIGQSGAISVMDFGGEEEGEEWTRKQGGRGGEQQKQLKKQQQQQPQPHQEEEKTRRIHKRRRRRRRQRRSKRRRRGRRRRRIINKRKCRGRRRRGGRRSRRRRRRGGGI